MTPYLSWPIEVVFPPIQTKDADCLEHSQHYKNQRTSDDVIFYLNKPQNKIVRVRTGQFSLGQCGENPSCIGGLHLNHMVWRTRPCYSTGHFPLGYLAMGKNVFFQINDMFIQKEVTTLFRSSAASKFKRKNESERERETESEWKEREQECREVCSFVLSAKPKRWGLDHHIFQMHMMILWIWKSFKPNMTLNWSPNPGPLSDLQRRPLSKQLDSNKSRPVSVCVCVFSLGSPPMLQHFTPTIPLLSVSGGRSHVCKAKPFLWAQIQQTQSFWNEEMWMEIANKCICTI